MTDAPAVLRRPQHQVSPRAVWYWTVRALIMWIIVAAAETFIHFAFGSGWSAWFYLVPAATAIVAATHLVVMPRWRYRVHRWEATPTAVYTQSGWFVQERRIAPIARIQTVDSERGPVEAFFGLTNVTVTTASAAGPISIHGLNQATAEKLVRDLTRIAQLAGGDGT
jgi:membrane protein YdbS with pleckstrin-like domain